MTDVENLNKYLISQGLSEDNKPLFRLVWSDGIYEHRHGLFRDYVLGTNILIREVTETRLVRKYNYINQRWILEKWAPGNLTYTKEIPGTESGDYIPVYVFEDKNGDYLPPNMKVLNFILAFLRGQIRKEDIPSQEYLDEKEIQLIEDELGNHPTFSTHGAARNSIAYRGKNGS